MTDAEKDVELRVTREDAENLVSGLYAFMPSCTNELVDDLRELVEYIERRVASPGADHEHVWAEAEVTSGPTMVGERLTVCAVCGARRED